MDKIFDTGSIEQICEEIKSILNDCKDHMETMRSTASEAQQAVASVPSDVRDASVDTAAEALKSAISNTDLDKIIRKLDGCRTRACTLIPAADKQYAQQTDQLAQTVAQIKDAAEQMRQFLVNAPFAADYDTFRRSFDAACAGWRKVMEDADTAVDEILKNVKGSKEISTVFSKDPVNLSTGNFIFDRTDLEIQGSMPFTFGRFYNSVNDREGVLGKDWNHNYEVFLEGPASEKVLVLEDGREERFTLTATGVYVSIYQSDGILEKTEDGFVYRTNSQEVYCFDEEGRYLSREDANGNKISLVYEIAGGKKRLVKVEKDTGESFGLSYSEEGFLDTVTDHTGRMVQYEVEGSCLKAATMPSGHSFRYAYTPGGKLESVMNPRGIVTVENAFDGQHRTIKQTFPDGTSMAYAYDDDNRTITMTERNGSKSVHIHDERYRNIKNIYPDGEERFEYNAQDRKTKVTDKLGNVTRMAYDSRGNLTSVINSLGTKLSVTYEAHNQPVSVSIDGKQKVKNRFDGRGNLLETFDALQRKTVFSYNGKGLPECITQADGSRVSLTYDERGNIRELKDARGGVTRYEYDKLNRVTETFDPNGNQTKYTYDKAGNLQTVANADGCIRTYGYNESNKVTKITDFDGSVIQRVYNVLNKPEKVIDQLGRETKLTYDAMWNLARVTEPNGAKTTYFYNGNNRLGRVKDAKGNVRRYTYDGNGNRLSETDENGAITRFAYDVLGQLIHVGGPEGLAYTYTYDKEGHVTEVMDALDGRVELTYDEAGQLIRETNQLGDSRSYTYTPLGNLESITDEAGRVTRYAYLPGGQLEKVIHSDGTTEGYTYDGNGNVKTYTNASGFTLSYFYDRLDRIIRIEGSGGEKKEYTYDAVGNVTSMTDALGNCTRYGYSLTGQLTKVIDPLGNETEYSYDVCDRLIEIRQYGEDGSLKEGADISGMDEELLEAERRNQRNRICHVTKYQRDPLGQVETITDALGLQENYSYDPKGQLTEKLDKEGYLTKYGYTGQGDVSRIQYADGREVKYSYNPLRHLQEMEDWLGITKIVTDPLGRAENVQYPDGKTVSYTYGKAGERTSITYPDGRTVYYGFDEQIRLSELRDGDQVITYFYDCAGRLAEKYFPNGMHTDYKYDSKGQIKELVHKDREGVLDKYIYQYDLLGNKTGIDKQRRWLEEESGSYLYGYDALGRLNEVVKDGNALRTYQYDAFGNRTRLTERGKQTTYAYNNVNQLMSRVDAYVEETYTYDKRGNLSQIVANGQIKNRYLYGVFNRLEQVVNGKGEAAKYKYNGLGHRVEKVVWYENFKLKNKELDPMERLRNQTISPEKQIKYTIDLTREYHNLLQKEEGNHTQTFLWDGNVAEMLEDGKDSASYYLQDELRSPIRMADKDGHLSDSYGYNEFGRDLYENQRKVQPFGYTGYQRDGIAKTYFAQAREYNAVNGMFLGQDVNTGLACFSFTLNQYCYCFNSPIMLVDLNAAWPSLSDIGEGLKEIGNNIINAGKKVVEEVKNIDWKSVGRTALNVAETVGAVAVGAVAVATVGSIVGTAAAVVAGVGIAANALYTGYSNYKNGKNFFDGLFIGSLNTSASVFAATVFGAPLPQNYIGTAGKIILNGGLNFVSGSLSSILLDGVNGDKINLTKSVYSGLLQGTVGGILGGALGVNASDQAWSAFAGLVQQLILERIGQEDATASDIIGEIENSLCIN